MADAIFPDNTVLCNFAAVHRLDLLEGYLRGRGRWAQAIAYEVGRSARYHPDLAGLAEAGWLGEPIVIDRPKDVEAVERIRRLTFGGSRSEPLRHLGESQTLWLLKQRGDFAGAWWISDDTDSLEASREERITTRETIDIMRGIVADGDLTAQEAYDLMHQMAAAGRHLRLPSASRDLI